jgi:hypothetical protein
LEFQIFRAEVVCERHGRNLGIKFPVCSSEKLFSGPRDRNFQARY